MKIHVVFIEVSQILSNSDYLHLQTISFIEVSKSVFSMKHLTLFLYQQKKKDFEAEPLDLLVYYVF